MFVLQVFIEEMSKVRGVWVDCICINIFNITQFKQCYQKKIIHQKTTNALYKLKINLC